MAKKVIRITESDIHNMVMESVKNILKESPYRDMAKRTWGCGGRIPRDGMTGGEWFESPWTSKYMVNISDVVSQLSEESYISGIQEELEKIETALYFNVKGKYGKDDSVGMKEGFYDVDADINPAVQAIMSCDSLSVGQKEEIEDILTNLANNIEQQPEEYINIKNIIW